MVKRASLKLSTLAEAEEQYLVTGERDVDDVDWNDPWLDKHLGPLSIGDLIFFSARTGTGKSFSLLRQLIMLDVPSLYVSLEDSMRKIGGRVASAPLPARAKERVQLFVPERPRMSLIRQAMEESGARVVGIDYLQIVQDDTGINAFNRMDQIRDIISETKGVLREQGQTGLMLSQLKRPRQQDDDDDDTEDEFGPGSRKEPRGTIYDNRDSSDIENEADGMILIHRLGRKMFDQTIAKAKSREGGQRRKFRRGNGGWPELMKALDTEEDTVYDELMNPPEL